MTTGASVNPVPELSVDVPAAVAARQILKKHLAVVGRLLPLAASGGEPSKTDEAVHDLRVATRRAGAALFMFKHYMAPRVYRLVRKKLRAIRRAAAEARRADVQLAALQAWSGEGGDLAAAAAWIRQDVARSRTQAQRQLEQAAKRYTSERLKQWRRQVLRSITNLAIRRAGTSSRNATAPFAFGALAHDRFGSAIDNVRTGMNSRTNDFGRLHALRLAGKRLRYTLEHLAGCTDPMFHDRVLSRLRQMQDQLGSLNDTHELLRRVESLLEGLCADRGAVGNGTRCGEDGPGVGTDEPPIKALFAAREKLREEQQRLMASFQDWWFSAEVQTDLNRLTDAWHLFVGAPPARRTARRRQRIILTNGAGSSSHMQPPQHWRVAAVDVGTNSIRLVVAESDPATKFRVIEDVRETTRLGAGLYQTGRISSAAMEQSLLVLERMRTIWEGHHVDRIRAVGTSAVREASNGREFIDQVRRRTGLRIEVIDQDYEARLAFSSVTNAFHLEDQRFAAVDLGGGSAELVLSTGELIDSIHKLPLGAVRLTDMFGLPGERGEYRFNAMRKAVDDMIDDQIPRPSDPLDLMVGTGGTFTTLARVSIRHGTQVHGEGRFSFAIRGYELTHGEVAFMLDWLRSLSLTERRQVAGMGYRRAEIIVAGLCVIERLMEHLQVDRLSIHDGGIRDGLLAEMIDDLTGGVNRGPAATRDTAARVRAFAERCRYDRAHSEHVAQLALRIFDQLAALFPEAQGSWAGADGREILHAAAVLHDVGILVSYRRHHRHSYDMILNANLPDLSRRMVAVIANVARYHRRRGPRRDDENVLRLREDDQRLLGHLAGILRIADGLDRSHRQSVRDVVVVGDADDILFRVVADESPTGDLRAARAKADVFEKYFRASVRFRWCGRETPERTRKRRS